jgi:hypothetical protein
MVYVKHSIQQYDKEEGETFRRQQQLQVAKGTTTTLSSSSPQRQPLTSSRTYGTWLCLPQNVSSTKLVSMYVGYFTNYRLIMRVYSHLCYDWKTLKQP